MYAGVHEVDGKKLNVKFMDVRQEAELVHEEHHSKVITKGLKVVINEREHNPFLEAEQQVLD